MRFHDLRHTFACLLIQDGEPLDLRARAARARLDPGDGRSLRALISSANSAAIDQLDAQPTRNPGATGEESADPKADAK